MQVSFEKDIKCDWFNARIPEKQLIMLLVFIAAPYCVYFKTNDKSPDEITIHIQEDDGKVIEKANYSKTKGRLVSISEGWKSDVESFLDSNLSAIEYAKAIMGSLAMPPTIPPQVDISSKVPISEGLRAIGRTIGLRIVKEEPAETYEGMA